MNYLKNKNGFTLIEMLLVLFIVLLISSIVFKVSMGISEKRDVTQFFNQLVFDLQEMQALAIEKDQTIIFQLHTENKYKANVSGTDQVIVEKVYPKNIKFEAMSNLKRIIINPNGDVSNFGTARFYTPYGETNLITYIKEGRMRLVEY
ncbi:MAG TPA: competence type IV pilus minor pilin ComGD [Ureibacillus sp.]|nr:competence type IV pilus minor pilin ComGD [Ureibacillus sp.]